MYTYLHGKVVSCEPMIVVLDVHGVGYELQISLHTYEQIKGAETITLHTHLQIREDAWVLYGFAQEAERQTFRLLLGISGVGSATARLILSSISSQELAQIVASQNVKALEKVKGIGAKTAQRILLELQGKLTASADANAPDNKTLHNTQREDALIALVNLGIAKSAAESALGKLSLPENTPVEEWIKLALRQL